MRTQVIPEHALGLPWLEHFSSKGGPAEKTILDKSPFVIGRGESADLQVVSQGVSREHAAVVREGGATRIRDLGSTNGTFVNGQRIKETDLRDGDMIQVANVEFAFYVGKSEDRRGTVTQVLPLDVDDDANDNGDAVGSDPAGDLRRAVRRLHEMLVSGCVTGRLKPIVELRQGQVVGYEASDEDVLPPLAENNLVLPAIPGRVVARLRHLRRLRGIEQAAAMPGESVIFVSFTSAEVASGRLSDLAGMCCESMENPDRLVIAVPFPAAREVAQALAPGGQIREFGARVAVSDLSGKEADMALLSDIRPDFVRLATSLMHGIQGYAKNLRAVQTMIHALSESGTKVIAAGISSASERAACLEVGCELGQGMLFEQRKQAEAPARKVISRGTPPGHDSFCLSLASEAIKRA